MKSIRLSDEVQGQLFRIAQPQALAILRAIHAYAERGEGDVKKLKPPLNDFRLRVGQYRVLFSEDSSQLRIHMVGHRREIYR